ncbi:endolytic transglycosylase MltG [Actinospongicola halichondriae]|uniref:endolytic transglycosylase MltG n=1 Tax=Actinospongicola halichondriae TaxID=3236844 RepID=UPI003D422980
MSDDDWMDDEDWSEDWADEGTAPWATDATLSGQEGWVAPTDSPDGEQRYEEWLEETDAEGGEWAEIGTPMSGRRRLLLGVGVVLAVLVLAAGGLYVWVQRQIDPAGAPGAEVEVEVVAGSTTEDIGVTLEDNGIITSSMVWNYWTRLGDKGPFQAGLYLFQENSSFDEAVAVLDAGPRPPENVFVTVPEGLTVAEIVPRLADPEKGLARWNADALAAALDSGEIRSQFQTADQPSMEGMLFPETYDVEEETDERSFIRRMVTQLDETLLALEVETKAAALGITPYEAVIIGSLIEEEARVPEDRTKISRVIHNRLAQGIPLGIDATNRYEAELAGRSRDDIDFSSDSPYNTRRVQGLPPTPIAAAGRASLEAALNPEPGDWLYYVLADAQGHHTFAETNSEFLAAKQECIRLDLGCG